MPVLTVSSPKWSIRIVSVQPIEPTDGAFLKFVNDLNKFDARVPLDAITSTGAGGTFAYTTTTSNGRSWRQSIRVNAPEPLLTFDVQDAWSSSEVREHLLLQDTALSMVRDSGMTELSVTKVKVEVIP